MPLPNRKNQFYSYPCEVGNHQISNSHLLPVKCQGCGRQMCVRHRIKWGDYCKACWPSVPPETKQSLIAKCKAISRANRIQFLKDFAKTLWLAPIWFAAYIWQSIKKLRKKETSTPKSQEIPLEPYSDHLVS